MNTASSIAYRVDYSIVRSTNSRTGYMLIASDGTTVTYDDNYNQSADLGVTLTVIDTGTNSDTELQYTTTSTGNNATIHYSIARLD